MPQISGLQQVNAFGRSALPNNSLKTQFADYPIFGKKLDRRLYRNHRNLRVTGGGCRAKSKAMPPFKKSSALDRKRNAASLDRSATYRHCPRNFR